MFSVGKGGGLEAGVLHVELDGRDADFSFSPKTILLLAVQLIVASFRRKLGFISVLLEATFYFHSNYC